MKKGISGDWSKFLTATLFNFSAKRFDLYVGSLNWRYTKARIAVSTTSRYVHTQYNDISLVNDIALVKMSTNLLTTYFTQGNHTKSTTFHHTQLIAPF